jgi:hypothetical protein
VSFCSPTDEQVNYLKNNIKIGIKIYIEIYIKIYIKIDIKTAPSCFGAVSHTIIRERITRGC